MTETSASNQQPPDAPADYTRHLPSISLPDNDDFTPGSTQLAQIGPISIYRGGWGVYVDSHAIAEAATQAGFPVDLATISRNSASAAATISRRLRHVLVACSELDDGLHHV